MKKGLLIGGGLVVVVIAVAVFYLWSNLGSVIKAAVEKYGSEITQAKVTLKRLLPDGAKGRASKSNLVNYAVNTLLREIEEKGAQSSIIKKILEIK